MNIFLMIYIEITAIQIGAIYALLVSAASMLSGGLAEAHLLTYQLFKWDEWLLGERLKKGREKDAQLLRQIQARNVAIQLFFPCLREAA